MAAPLTWLMGNDAFHACMPHHDGIAALWATRWQQPCRQSTYPFHDGHYDDFAPVFARLIAGAVDDPTTAAYTEAFFPEAEALAAEADRLLATGEAATASGLYLRACALYRIARFPYIAATTPDGTPPDAAKWRAWQAQKTLYLRAAATWAAPVREVLVPHVHGRAGEGTVIPVYVRMPGATGAGTGSAATGQAGQAVPVPVVILMTGLDGYRPDNTGRCDAFAARGWASVVLEIPGTADCPADAADAASAERLWDSLLGWIDGTPALDAGRIAVWGLSAGGYYAVRAAHTHAARLAAVVAQGAGVHHGFGAAWLARADGHEYPFALTPALAAQHGYGSAAAFAAEGQARFSLLLAGDGRLLDGPSARLLVVNGTRDGLMPIEDTLLLLEHGRPKTARLVAGALHMGYPEANTVVYPWLEEVLR